MSARALRVRSDMRGYGKVRLCKALGCGMFGCLKPIKGPVLQCRGVSPLFGGSPHSGVDLSSSNQLNIYPTGFGFSVWQCSKALFQKNRNPKQVEATCILYIGPIIKAFCLCGVWARAPSTSLKKSDIHHQKATSSYPHQNKKKRTYAYMRLPQKNTK